MKLPKSIQITVKYDKTLQKITGRSSDPVIMSEGAPFHYLLFNVFQSYPKIEQQFPPGQLAFSVNGERPAENQILCDDDVVEFSTLPGPKLNTSVEVLLKD